MEDMVDMEEQGYHRRNLLHLDEEKKRGQTQSHLKLSPVPDVVRDDCQETAAQRVGHRIDGAGPRPMPNRYYLCH